MMRAKKKINIKKIIKQNPGIDKELFEKSRKQLDELKKIGTRRTEYNLVVPFTRSIQLPE